MNGRAWSHDDDAKLRRLLAAGYTQAQIGNEMKRHHNVIRAKSRALGLDPAQSPVFTAMMARINARRRAQKVRV